MSRNQIAAISGLSNPYIQNLEQGSIANVGREKLISFAIALNLSLEETDDLLTVFDRAKLTTEDIPIFLDSSKRCRISAAMHPVHDSYTFDLVTYSAERIPGTHVIVSSRPASCLRAAGHRIYAEKSLVEAHPVYGELAETITRVRRQNIIVNLTQYPLKQYVCKACLEDYIHRCEDPEERDWRDKHVKNTIAMINSFENFHFFLTNDCPSFIFFLKMPPAGSEATEQLIITVLPPHRFQVRTSGLLSGFATDNQAVILNFKKELSFIKASVIDEFRDRQRVLDYLEALIAS